MKINGEMHYLWRAVDHEGEVLESVASKTRDKPAALKFMKKLMKRLIRETAAGGVPRAICGHRPVLPFMLEALGVPNRPMQMRLGSPAESAAQPAPHFLPAPGGGAGAFPPCAPAPPLPGPATPGRHASDRYGRAVSFLSPFHGSFPCRKKSCM